MDSSTTDRYQPNTLLAIGTEIEESFSELKLDPQDTSPCNIQGDGAAKKESLMTNGSKMHHGSKGKQQRDRRKLREKRRSTGVVHLASTESAGEKYGRRRNAGGHWIRD